MTGVAWTVGVDEKTVFRLVQHLAYSGFLNIVAKFHEIRKGTVMPIPQLLVHDHEDNVGVVVVEGLTAATEMLCVVTADNSDFKLKANADIPIGHKVALKALKEGDTVIKYGEDIGKMIGAVHVGDHVHVPNCKTKRW